MREHVEVPSDPALLWMAIQNAAQEGRSSELAEIAISLHGQLGEARDEISGLRASLRSSLSALTMTVSGGYP